MKYFLLAVAILAGAAYVRTEEPGWCRCAMFVSSRHSEIMVFQLPEVNVTDCNDHSGCQNRCTKEISEMTNNLDLWSTVDGETVGSYICKKLYSYFFFFMHNSQVHGYYQLCGGPWEYTGLDSQQMLCCNLGEHVHCISK
ncbi:uncharacterized protein [Panulirus ornatus]|uniref:uncharacterized protein n=1 Tax=Panulirus ornatus TaxID=150431 RepID=UPI003A88409B